MEKQLNITKSRGSDADDQFQCLPMEAAGSLPMTLKKSAEVTD